MPAFHKGKLIPRAIIALLCAALFCGALSVAAAESKNVPFVFENGAMQSSVASEWGVEMDDAWFSAPASTYNHKLAQLSIAMALSAFRNRRMPLGKQDNNLQSFLESADHSLHTGGTTRGNFAGKFCGGGRSGRALLSGRGIRRRRAGALATAGQQHGANRQNC